MLQERSLVGCEPKPLPFLLCEMNLLLHGLDSPRIDPNNALRFKLSEIGEKDRVDVILTNPPFGGEEERGVQGNFPEDRQTGETALLFLQLIMRKLHRQPTAAKHPARAAVVVPNGTLFGDGVCARIKEELLQGLQPAHHCPPAERGIRPVYQHPDEHPVLRPLWANAGRLVLRTPPPRKPEELYDDAANSIRRVP
jgi:N-6 DNA Methylase